MISTSIAHLAELKTRIAKHILNVTPETLRSIVEMLFLVFNFLQKMVVSILSMFYTSLVKFKKQFDACFYAVFVLRISKNRFFLSVVI